MRFVLLIAMAAGLNAEGPFAFRQVNSDSLELTENGKPVYVYNHGMVLKEGLAENWRRSCYVHPLYAPDGTIVTDDFPKDHPHHRGVFWAWPVVKVDGATYDPWAVNGIHDRLVRWIARDANNDWARMAVENGWFVGDQKVLAETVEIVSHPTQAGSRTLDVQLTFEAMDKPVEISGSPQLNKGYGGLGVRFAARERTVIRTERGIEEKDSDRVAYPWAALTGSFQGHAAGPRIDDDPGNPGFPNGWCLRKYGYLGVSFPGLDRYVFEPHRPLTLKYKITAFAGSEPK